MNTNTCRSVYTWAHSSWLLNTRCIKPLHHIGDCRDAEGHTWTRVAEWLRRGKEAAR